MKEELRIIEQALDHAHARGAFTNIEPLRTVQWWSALNALKQKAEVEEQQRGAIEEAERIRQAMATAGANAPDAGRDVASPRLRSRKAAKAAAAAAQVNPPCLPCDEKAKAEQEKQNGAAPPAA